MDEDDVAEMCEEAGMKRMQKKLFLKAVQKLKAAPSPSRAMERLQAAGRHVVDLNRGVAAFQEEVRQEEARVAAETQATANRDRGAWLCPWFGSVCRTQLLLLRNVNRREAQRVWRPR